MVWHQQGKKDIIIIILKTVRGQGGPSVQIYSEKYIHNKN